MHEGPSALLQGGDSGGRCEQLATSTQVEYAL